MAMNLTIALLWGQKFCNDFSNKIVAQAIEVVIQTYLCFVLAILKVENPKGLFSSSDGFSLFCFQENFLKKSLKASWHSRYFKCKMKLPPPRISANNINLSVCPKTHSLSKTVLWKCVRKIPQTGSHWVSGRGRWRKVSDYWHPPPMTDFNSQSGSRLYVNIGNFKSGF